MNRRDLEMFARAGFPVAGAPVTTNRHEDRILEGVRDAADRYREAGNELHEAVELARDMGLTDAQIEQAREQGMQW